MGRTTRPVEITWGTDMPKIKTTFDEPPEDGRRNMPLWDTDQIKRSEPDPNTPSLFSRTPPVFPSTSSRLPAKNYTVRSIHAKNRAQEQDAYMRYTEDHQKPQSDRW